MSSYHLTSSDETTPENADLIELEMMYVLAVM